MTLGHDGMDVGMSKLLAGHVQEHHRPRDQDAWSKQKANEVGFRIELAYDSSNHGAGACPVWSVMCDAKNPHLSV